MEDTAIPGTVRAPAGGAEKKAPAVVGIVAGVVPPVKLLFSIHTESAQAHRGAIAASGEADGLPACAGRARDDAFGSRRASR